MKKILLNFLIICFAFSFNCYAQSDMIIEQYESMDIDDLFEEAESAFPGFDGEKIISSLSSGNGFEGKKITQILLEFVFESFINLSKTFFLILVIGFFISLLHTVAETFGGGSSKIAILVGYTVFSGVLISVFVKLIQPAKDMICSLITMIKVMIPTLLSLMTFSGGVNTSILMSSVVVSMINVISVILGEYIFNVTMSITALSVADNMSDSINISSGIRFLRQFVKWVILFCMAIYSGIYGVYGLAGTALDSRVGKAAKFAVGSSVPIVGGVVSESIEMILGTVGALKNLTGVTGIIGICAIGVYPIIKTALVVWMMRLCAAVLEPISDKKIVKLVSDVADNASIVFAVMVSICLLFIGCVGVVLLSGNFYGMR